MSGANREIEEAAREYLAQTAIEVMHERVGSDPIQEIRERIHANIAAADRERSRLVPLIERFEAIKARIRHDGEGENFLAAVVQRKIDELNLNRLQLQVMAAKMHVAREMLAAYRYARVEAPPDLLPHRGAHFLTGPKP